MFFRATEALKQSGPSVTLQILKDAANHHGLSALFTSSSKNHHQLVIQPLRATQSTYYQSNPDLFASKQQSDNSPRNLSKTQSLVLREDISSEPIINKITVIRQTNSVKLSKTKKNFFFL